MLTFGNFLQKIVFHVYYSFLLKDICKVSVFFELCTFWGMNMFGSFISFIPLVNQVHNYLYHHIVIQSEAKDLGNILYAIEILPPYGRLNDKKKSFMMTHCLRSPHGHHPPPMVSGQWSVIKT